MKHKPKVIDLVVESDLCIGCGLCVYQCPSKAINMHWNEFGFLIPMLSGNCDSNGECLKVCPFNPFPSEETKTENELAEIFLEKNIKHHLRIGKYHEIYAGYANNFRHSSSSGGMATYFFTELLKKGIVNHVISVKKSTKEGCHYEFAISSSKEEILSASKTRYYPVSMNEALNKIHELNGKIAISGIACFIKAIRLLQHQVPELREKIAFLVGIICGGVKSRFFTDYLADKAGAHPTHCKNPQYRLKDLDSDASDYSFSCTDNTDRTLTIKMRSIGDMWGTGLFKANACDFCDDVTTELADVSLGDAWIKPYNLDGRGTNLFITRSSLADSLVQDGIGKNKLTIERIELSKFLVSQRGSFNHRHTGLSYRINKRNQSIPPKRFGKEKVSLDFKVVQNLRMKIRKESLLFWEETPDAKLFEKKMYWRLNLLKLTTTFYHYKKIALKKLRLN